MRFQFPKRFTFPQLLSPRVSHSIRHGREQKSTGRMNGYTDTGAAYTEPSQRDYDEYRDGGILGPL
jgi:hypothetical protein